MNLRTLILTFSVCAGSSACSHTVAVRETDVPKPLPLTPPAASAPGPGAESDYSQIPKRNTPPSVSPSKEPESAKKEREPSSKPELMLTAAPALPANHNVSPTPGPAMPSQVSDAPPTPPESPLLTALRDYLSGRPADALAILKRYDQATQEVLICLLPLIARTSDTSLQAAKPHEYSNVLDELERLSDRIRPRADLAIEKMCFCNSYQSFGIYLPVLVESPRFQVGQRVKLYVELKNFTSEWRDNAYMIYHKSTLTFLGFDGQPVTFNYRGRIVSALPIDEERPDKSRSLRHDFAYHYDFQIPHMPPGFYTLVLRVTDVPTGRSAERTLDFQVRHPE
jgi:hypothetical protein